jgi:hypothetical protein
VVSIRLASAAILTVAALMVNPSISKADPALHHVTYSVTSEQPFHAEIYYREADPPTFADYSHDPYQYSPNVEVDVGPDKPWVFGVMLTDPNQWAMVAATSGQSPATPMFHCQLLVDGVVAATGEGTKGALCSLRHW